MKRVIITTIIDNINIGTYLQAYALAYCIERMGYKSVVVDYYRNSSTLSYKIKTIINNQKKTITRKILSLGYAIVYSLIRKRLFSSFKRRINITKNHYTSFNELLLNPPLGDIYITGSDQVWNSEYNHGIDRSFYLDFVGNTSTKVAYAASVGLDFFPENERETVKKLLLNYSRITMRESDSCILLKEMGINDVKHVLDPTLLLTANEWCKLGDSCRFNKVAPYLLIYSVEGRVDKLLFEQAKIISRQRGLKIYILSTEWNSSRIECDKFFSFSLPNEFIKLFSLADFILVSSFHGTAFSINFNKEFLTFMPEKYSVRTLSLLKQFKLEDRLWKENSDLETLTAIDYKRVNVLLNDSRNKSFRLLSEMLNVD